MNSFKANGLQFYGARPTQFEVFVFPPFASPATPKVRFLCRAASIPPAPLDTILVPYFGRKIPVPGDRDFPQWTVTVMNDEDFALRKMFEKWSNLMNTMISNVMDDSVFPQGFATTAQVLQYGKRGDQIAAYEFQNLWPTNVDTIPLDWDATNQFEQFDVTFVYSQWVPVVTGAGGPDDFTGVSPNDGLG